MIVSKSEARTRFAAKATYRAYIVITEKVWKAGESQIRQCMCHPMISTPGHYGRLAIDDQEWGAPPHISAEATEQISHRPGRTARHSTLDSG